MPYYSSYFLKLRSYFKQLLPPMLLTITFTSITQASEINEQYNNDTIVDAQFLTPTSLANSDDIGDLEINYKRPSINTSEILPHVTINGTGNDSPVSPSMDFYSFDAELGDRVLLDIDADSNHTGPYLLLTLYDPNQSEIENISSYNTRDGAGGSVGYQNPIIAFEIDDDQFPAGTYTVRVAQSNGDNVDGLVGFPINPIDTDSSYQLHVSVGDPTNHNIANCNAQKYYDCDGDGIHDSWEIGKYLLNHPSTTLTDEEILAEVIATRDDDADGRNNLSEFRDHTNPYEADIASTLVNDDFTSAPLIHPLIYSLDHNPHIGDMVGNTSESIPHVTINVDAGVTNPASHDYYRISAEEETRIIADIDGSFNHVTLWNDIKPYPIRTVLRLFKADAANTLLASSAGNYGFGYGEGSDADTDGYDGYLEYTVPAGQGGEYIVVASTGHNFVAQASFDPIAQAYWIYPVGQLNSYRLHLSAQAADMTQVQEQDDNDTLINAQLLTPASFTPSDDIGDLEIHYKRQSINTSEILPHVTVNGTGNDNPVAPSVDYYKFSAASSDRVLLDIDADANHYGPFYVLTLYGPNTDPAGPDPIEYQMLSSYNTRDGAGGSGGTQNPMLTFEIDDDQFPAGTYTVRVALSNGDNVGALNGFPINPIDTGLSYRLHVSIGDPTDHNLLNCSDKKYDDCDGDDIHDDWEIAQYLTNDPSTTSTNDEILAQIIASADDDNDGRDNLNEYYDRTNMYEADLASTFDNDDFATASLILPPVYSLDHNPYIGDMVGNTSESIPHVTINVDSAVLNPTSHDYYRINPDGGTKIIADIDGSFNHTILWNNIKPYPVRTVLRLYKADDANTLLASSAGNYGLGYGQGSDAGTDGYDGYLEYTVPTGQGGEYIVLASTGHNFVAQPSFDPIAQAYWIYPVGQLNSYRLHLSVDPEDSDSDGDGMPDWYEIAVGLNPEIDDAGDDSDVDGLTNLEEYLYGAYPAGPHPLMSDTDADGINDGEEVRWQLKPHIHTDNQDIFDPTTGVSIYGDCEDDKRILHILNRLSFGPTKELYDELKGDTSCSQVPDPSTGLTDSQTVEDNIANWISAQLNENGESPGIVKDEKTGFPGEKERRAGMDEFGTVIPRLPVVGLVALKENTDLNDIIEYVSEAHPTDKYSFKLEPAQEFIFSNEVRPYPFCYVLSEPDDISNRCENSYDPGQCQRDIHREFWSNGVGHDRIAANIEAIRPIKSKQHLRTLLGRFWDNHFTTDRMVLNDEEQSKRLPYSTWNQEIYESDTFFMGAFGSFYDDLLLQSAQSPTMIYFLNQDDNVAPEGCNENNCEYVANENYARELLELHTMGEDNGYTQQTVVDLARLLTGWSVSEISADQLDATGALKSRYQGFIHARDEGGGLTREEQKSGQPKESGGHYGLLPCLSKTLWTDQDHSYAMSQESKFHPEKAKANRIIPFKFFSDSHDDSAITVDFESHTFEATTSGEQKIKDVLQHIANQPETANFICTKLARLLIGDDDGLMTNAITDCENEFNISNETQIKRSVGALINSVAFNDRENHRGKYKDFWEYGYGLARLFEMPVDQHNNDFRYLPGYVMASHSKANPRVFQHPSPDGLPEISDEWRNTEQALVRMDINGNLMQTNSNVYSKHLAKLLATQLFNKGSTSDFNISIQVPDDADMQIAVYLLKIMFGGYYDNKDIELVYKAMNFGQPFLVLNIHEGQYYINNTSAHKLLGLVQLLSSHYKYSLQ